MRNFLLMLAVVVVLALNVAAQETAKLPTISVNGTAEILAPPDEVIFTLDVTKRNKDQKVAKAEADSILVKVVDAAKRFKIEPENIKTDRISVEMKYQSIRDPKNRIYDEDGDEVGTRIFLGYDASTRVVIKLRDIAKFETFFDDLVNTGVSEIVDVSFNSSKMIDIIKEARQQAMKAAFDKATAMAGAIGQTIGKAISIAEVSTGDRSNISSGVFANATSSQGPVTVTKPVSAFSPGALKISSQVAVVFILN